MTIETSPQPADLLPAVLEAVAAASTAIMEVYASSHDVEYKSDESPITRADRAAHEILAARLARIAPAIPVLSEEAEASHALAVRGPWQQLWLVDPLDGTKEFISRNGEFTVNVALVRNDRPVLGVVAAPALGLTYYAAEGGGAFRRRDGAAAEPIRVRPAADPLVVVGSRSHRGSSLDTFLERIGPHELVATGSSLKFCRVAEGEADIYPRLAPTSEWDTAAAQAILEGAGGVVVDLQGMPLLYGKPEVINPSFIATRDKALIPA